MNFLEIVAAIAIVGYVIGRQLLGEHLRGKRLIVLPIVLAAIGANEVLGHGHHLGASDIGLLAIGAVAAAGIGIGQGSLMHLEARDGTLWGQMPLRGLWLWAGLVAARVVLDIVASGMGAHLAAGTAPILLMLGINRLAQAAVVAPRAMAAGIPFAPEKNGSTFLGGTFGESCGQASKVPSAVSPRSDGRALSDWQSGMRVIADRISANAQQR
jgi:hypothetical protein